MEKEWLGGRAVAEGLGALSCTEGCRLCGNCCRAWVGGGWEKGCLICRVVISCNSVIFYYYLLLLTTAFELLVSVSVSAIDRIHRIVCCCHIIFLLLSYRGMHGFLLFGHAELSFLIFPVSKFLKVDPSTH